MNEKKKLQARDFITIGTFTAILWVVQMVIMYMGFLSPFVVAGYAVLIPIVTGIPMMLYTDASAGVINQMVDQAVSCIFHKKLPAV